MTGPNQHQERPWKSGDVVKDAQLLYELLMHTDGLTVEQDHRLHGILTLDIPRLVEQFDALHHAAGDFVTAYRAASMSDEEGLLMAADPDAMRQLWHRVDEAATDVEQAL